jgi:alpha-tubulin suppressor-like RCC1 family protein
MSSIVVICAELTCALSQKVARRGSLPILTTIAVALALALVSAAPASAASYGAVSWGMDVYGQLGNGVEDPALFESETPVAPAGLTGVKEVAAGGETSIALLADGTVMAWGENYFGQLGNGSATGPEWCDSFAGIGSACSATPVQVSGLSGVKAVAAGYGDGYALLKDGTVMAWGENADGQLGVGTDRGPEGCITDRGAIPCSTIPVRVSGLRGVRAIAAGSGYGLALLKDGTVMGWGDDDVGQLGGVVNPESCGHTPCSTTPVPVSGLSGVKAIAAGQDHALAILHNGTVMAWGHGGLGELGNGTQTISSPPVAVSGLSGVTAIAAGAFQSLALLEDGRVMAWGMNAEGQLGDGTSVGPETCTVWAPSIPCSTTPVAVSGLSGVTAIAAGAMHSLAVLQDGAVMGWGWNEYGQLGVDESGPDPASAWPTAR